jgi:hypothetical protein
MLYYSASGDVLKAFSFSNGSFSQTTTSQSSNAFGYPGATPSISANGNQNAILWAAENSSPAVLHAYDATNLATELYNSNQAANSRDHFGTGNKYIVPTVANGKVYVGTTNGVGVFGLLCSYALTPTHNSFPVAGATGQVTVTASSGCPWSASSNAAWLTSSSSGTGNGIVNYTVAANSGLDERGGTLTIGGQIFVVTQAGTSPVSTLSRAGIFRSVFFWLLDEDGNRQWNTPPDAGVPFGGIAGDITITGDWNGDGRTKVGIYRSSTGLFILDYDGDRQFTGADRVYNLGVGTQAGDVPVVGDWNGSGTSKVGLFRQGFFWILDTNGDGVFQQGIDATYAFGGVAGDVPIVGDWNGSGTSKIGLFRSGFYWILVVNGNGTLDHVNQGGDQAFAFGGIAGDVPIVGDWNGDGTSKVGVFRGGFFRVLDANGNHMFDGTGSGQDLAFAFVRINGDTPVIGKW